MSLRSLAYCAPALPGFAGGPKTYAAWPVWSDSVRAEVRSSPLPKKAATRLYHKARAWNRAAKVAGRYGGALGSSALRVLEALIFDFLNYASGRLDPSYESIARKTGLGRSTVAEALKRLKALRVITWLRRCTEDHDGAGQYRLRQETNAYGLLPPSQWLGFIDPEPPAPPPHPSAWGATPPLPDVLDQATQARRDGASGAALARILESDEGDGLAAALARLGRAIGVAGGANS